MDRFERLDFELIRLLYRKERALLERGAGAARLEALLRRLETERGAALAAARSSPALRTPQRLILLITHRCQLRCRYCRVRKFGADMSESVVSDAVRLLFTSPRRELQLQFFGGEPLLRFDLIRRAVAEAEARRGGRRLSYLLTTNGIALDATVLEFLGRHRFDVEFSCDGVLGAQRRQRRAAAGRAPHARVLRNLEALRDSGIAYFVIAVTTPDSVGRLFEEFRSLAELGHRRIQVNYCLGRFWAAAAVRTLLAEMDRIRDFVASRPELEFVNATAIRREPVVLNAELTVDCDGGIYRETGVCLEEDFSRAKRDFFVADVAQAGRLDRLGSSPFDNFRLLADVYGRRRPAWRRIILNNIETGWAADAWVRGLSRRPAAAGPR